MAPSNSSCNFPSWSQPGPPHFPVVVQHPHHFPRTFTPPLFSLCLSLQSSIQAVNRWPSSAAREVENSGLGPSGKDNEQAGSPAVCLMSSLPPYRSRPAGASHSLPKYITESLLLSKSFVYLFIFVFPQPLYNSCSNCFLQNPAATIKCVHFYF